MRRINEFKGTGIHGNGRFDVFVLNDQIFFQGTFV